MRNESEKKPRRRIKKVKGHGGHHGGAWKVAYADFVTAMMALFLVLWLVSQADTKVKQAIAQYFRSPGVFATVDGGVLAGPSKLSKEPTLLTSQQDEQALSGAAALLQKEFSSKPEFSKFRDRVKIQMTEEGLRIDILEKAERVSFDSGSAALSPEAQSFLKEIAAVICSLPNPIIVGGHTDRHLFPPNSTYTNWELSADRANAARRKLEASCDLSSRIRRVMGYADTEPLLPDDPYAPANRRISLVVMRLAPPPKEPKDTEVVEKPDPKAKKEGEANPPATRQTEQPEAKDSKSSVSAPQDRKRGRGARQNNRDKAPAQPL
jgi:chemotaxis protein MotB